LILWPVPIERAAAEEASSLAYLREPSGHDELAIEGAGPLSASKLLERLLVEVPGAAIVPRDVWNLPLYVRDRLVAFLHVGLFGERLVSLARCANCGDGFELTFSLADLLETQRASREEALRAHWPGPDGTYAVRGVRFRLPTAADEVAVAGLSATEAGRALYERCVVDARGGEDEAREVQAAMEEVGPVLDLDLDGSCPHCRTAQPVRFDMVGFLLAALERERPLLLREVHRIATAYHWGFDEIMKLPRSVRRAHVGLIEGERGRAVA
jgi:hypothetical protein